LRLFSYGLTTLFTRLSSLDQLDQKLHKRKHLLSLFVTSV